MYINLLGECIIVSFGKMVYNKAIDVQLLENNHFMCILSETDKTLNYLAILVQWWAYLFLDTALEHANSSVTSSVHHLKNV